MDGISRSRGWEKENPHCVLPMEQLVLSDKWARKYLSGKSATIQESNHGLGVRVELITKKLHFVSQNRRMENKFCSMWLQLSYH